MRVQDSPGGGAAGGDHSGNQREKGQQSEGQTSGQDHWYVLVHTPTHTIKLCHFTRIYTDFLTNREQVITMWCVHNTRTTNRNSLMPLPVELHKHTA